MFDVDKLKELMAVTGTILSDMTLKDIEASIDGNSVTLLTAKVNAMLMVLLKDKSEEVKLEFKEAWKEEYSSLLKAKRDITVKTFNSEEFKKATGFDSDNEKLIEELIIKPIQESEEKVAELIPNITSAIDNAEL